MDDHKIHSMTDSEFRVLIYLMCLANRQQTRGVIPLKPTQVSRILRLHTNKVTHAVETFQKLGILEVQNSNPSMIFINWNKRQFQSDDSYARVKRFRNGQRNVTVTAPDTDTDTDTEKKSFSKEKKKTYGELKNVRLTSNEYEKLIEKYGRAYTGKMIDNLSTYIASKGKRYKSHYATILNWTRDEKTGKPKKMLTCSNPKCKHRSTLVTKDHCPVCGRGE